MWSCQFEGWKRCVINIILVSRVHIFSLSHRHLAPIIPSSPFSTNFREYPSAFVPRIKIFAPKFAPLPPSFSWKKKNITFIEKKKNEIELKHPSERKHSFDIISYLSKIINGYVFLKTITHALSITRPSDIGVSIEDVILKLYSFCNARVIYET